MTGEWIPIKRRYCFPATVQMIKYSITLHQHSTRRWHIMIGKHQQVVVISETVLREFRFARTEARSKVAHIEFATWAYPGTVQECITLDLEHFLVDGTSLWHSVPVDEVSGFIRTNCIQVMAATDRHEITRIYNPFHRQRSDLIVRVIVTKEQFAKQIDKV